MLQSERLVLTGVTVADAAAVLEYCQDEQLQRYTRVPVPYTRADADYFTSTYVVQASRDEHLCLWAIRARDAARTLLGTVELRLDSVPSGEVGYWIGAPHRATGLMTEALTRVIDHAFDPAGFDLQTVRWNAVVGNEASAVVARRCGFRLRGILEKHIVIRDEAHDAWIAELNRGDSRASVESWQR